MKPRHMRKPSSPLDTTVIQDLLLMMIQMLPHTGFAYANAHSRMMRTLALAKKFDHLR